MCRQENNDLLGAESCGPEEPRCLLPEWKCDGIRDCENGFDESECDGSKLFRLYNNVSIVYYDMMHLFFLKFFFLLL